MSVGCRDTVEGGRRWNRLTVKAFTNAINLQRVTSGSYQESQETLNCITIVLTIIDLRVRRVQVVTISSEDICLKWSLRGNKRGSCAFRLMQLQLAIFILLTICGTDNKEGPPERGRKKKFFLSVMHSKTWSRETWNWSYVGQHVKRTATRGH